MLSLYFSIKLLLWFVCVTPFLCCVVSLYFSIKVYVLYSVSPFFLEKFYYSSKCTFKLIRGSHKILCSDQWGKQMFSLMQNIFLVLRNRLFALWSLKMFRKAWEMSQSELWLVQWLGNSSIYSSLSCIRTCNGNSDFTSLRWEMWEFWSPWFWSNRNTSGLWPEAGMQDFQGSYAHSCPQK